MATWSASIWDCNPFNVQARWRHACMKLSPQDMPKLVHNIIAVHAISSIVLGGIRVLVAPHWQFGIAASCKDDQTSSTHIGASSIPRARGLLGWGKVQEWLTGVHNSRGDALVHWCNVACCATAASQSSSSDRSSMLTGIAPGRLSMMDIATRAARCRASPGVVSSGSVIKQGSGMDRPVRLIWIEECHAGNFRFPFECRLTAMS